jgi:7,8-dihydroneopterin aldolase/epimerase/oxygenase
MKNLIEVTGIEVFAYHGCMDEEALLGGKYIVDIVLSTDFTKSAESDELIDTIDYVAVRNIVVEEMAIRSKLIEHVAFPTLITASVKVRKQSPPIQGLVKEVAVIIEG